MDTAKLVTNDDSNGEPAIVYQKVSIGQASALQGYISVHKKLFTMAVEEGYEGIKPFVTRYQPMIVPPKDYTGPSGGCYKVLPVEVMRTENSVVQKVRF